MWINHHNVFHQISAVNYLMQWPNMGFYYDGFKFDLFPIYYAITGG